MPGRRWVVPLLGLIALACLATVYVVDPPLYFGAVRALMMRPYQTPFMDLAQLPGAVGCWQHGVDPYVVASCDFLDRAFAYSPLWLRAGFLPTAQSATPWLGAVLAASVFLSLPLLPPPSGRGGVIALALAAFSSLPAFAMERGNLDIAMFLMIIVGGWLCFRASAARLFGYPFFLLAGLLKFYPLVLCLLFLRERLGRAVLLGLATFALLALFVVQYRAELAEMARNLPNYGYFKDAFGARQLAGGIGVALHALGIERLPFLADFEPEKSAWLAVATLLLSHLAALATALWFAMKPSLRSALAMLTEAERGFLVIGAALICGCFFVGQNASYRGILFLFVVPGIARLALAPEPGPGRHLFRIAGGLILCLLWGLSLQQLVAWLSGGTDSPMGGSAAMNLYWILHEIAWWWVIAVLLGVLFCFVAEAPLWRSLLWRRAQAA